MYVDSIQNGVVIDHISAGGAMRLYNLLNLQDFSFPVAMITRVQSKKIGVKDIIKIDGDVSLNMDVIGYAEPGATINIIKDNELIEKKIMKLPERLVNVIRCNNPRCITSCEQELDQVFVLTDSARKVYRCLYCETKG